MICPKCGANLPDTAELCWSCRKTFVTDEESLTQGTIPIHKMSIKEEIKESFDAPKEEQQPIKTITPIMPLSDDNEDYVPSNYHQRKSLMVKASLLGLAGVIMLILSIFLFKPFLRSSQYYIQYGFVEKPMETVMYFGVILIYLLLLFYSIPGLKYTKGDAYGKLIFCIGGFMYSFWYMSHFSKVDWAQMQYTKETYDLYWWELKTSFQTFRVLTCVGYALTFISGLMLTVSAYTKDEKDMMKHNTKVK